MNDKLKCRIISLFGLMCAVLFCVGAVSNPFAIEARNVSTIKQYPFSQFVMLGSVRSGDVMWAIIRAPDQQYYRCAVDDTLGREDARIINISADKLIAIFNDSNHRLNVETLWLNGG